MSEEFTLSEIQKLVDKILYWATVCPEQAKEKFEELMKAIYGGKVQITFTSHKEPNHEKQSDLRVTGDKQAPKSPLQEIWEVFDGPKTQ